MSLPRKPGLGIVGISHYCSANSSHGCGHSPLLPTFPVEAHSSHFLSISSLHHGLDSVLANVWGSAACSTVRMCESTGPSSLYSLATTTLPGFSSQLVLMSQLENHLGELLQCVLNNPSDWLLNNLPMAIDGDGNICHSQPS